MGISAAMAEAHTTSLVLTIFFMNAPLYSGTALIAVAGLVAGGVDAGIAFGARSGAPRSDQLGEKFV